MSLLKMSTKVSAVTALVGLHLFAGTVVAGEDGDRVIAFVQDIVYGRVERSQIATGFDTLRAELDPIDVVRTLYSIYCRPDQIVPDTHAMGAGMCAMSLTSAIPGPIVWQSLTPEFARPESRRIAIEFIKEIGKQEEVFVSLSDSSEMPPAYWAAINEVAPDATFSAFQQEDGQTNPSHFVGDSKRQYYYVRLILATKVLDMRRVFEGGERMESGRGVFQPTIDAIDGQCKESMRFLLSHEAWWVRMYGVSVLKRCEALRTPELVGLLDKETDDKVLYFLQEEPKLKRGSGF